MYIFNTGNLLYNMSKKLTKHEGENPMNFQINLNNTVEENHLAYGVYKGEVTVPDKYVCKKGAKKFSRFFYVLQGTIVFNKNTPYPITASAGSVVYLPYDITYVSEWEPFRNGQYISINFIRDEFNFELPNYICIAATDTQGNYYELFNDAYEIWRKGAVGYQIELLSYIYKLLYWLFRDSTYSDFQNSYQVIYKGIFYLENHYTEDFSIEMLANLCNLSPSSFRRYFKFYSSLSPITYRNYLRIKKAKELLLTGEYTVTEVACAVNIPDLCYFNKLFRKFYHTPPSEYLTSK